MATSPEYRDHIVELLSPFHPVHARSMFGGVGLFTEDTMFALISSEDVVYFKTDDSNRADYEAAGMERYGRMPYYQVPADVLESPEALKTWVDKSVAIAKAGAKKKKKKRK